MYKEQYSNQYLDISILPGLHEFCIVLKASDCTVLDIEIKKQKNDISNKAKKTN